MKITKPATFEIGVDELAAMWCELDDDAQAQFFVHAALIMQGWPSIGRHMQPHLVGNHLRDCDCVTPEARELVEAIHYGMTCKRAEVSEVRGEQPAADGAA